MPNIDTLLLIILRPSFGFPSWYLLSVFQGQEPTQDTTAHLDVTSSEPLLTRAVSQTSLGFDDLHSSKAH